MLEGLRHVTGDTFNGEQRRAGAWRANLTIKMLRDRRYLAISPAASESEIEADGDAVEEYLK